MIEDVAWCKLTGLIATACGDDQIRIFKEADVSSKNEPTFELESKILAHRQDVNTVRWNPVVAGMLLSTSDDGDLKIWKFNL
jgi:cytosolic iron-sulfur protein assembly protein CIAO1